MTSNAFIHCMGYIDRIVAQTIVQSIVPPVSTISSKKKKNPPAMNEDKSALFNVLFELHAWIVLWQIMFLHIHV